MPDLRTGSLFALVIALAGCGTAPTTDQPEASIAAFPSKLSGKDIAVYHAAIRLSTAGQHGVKFLKVNGIDPPPELLSQGLRPASRCKLGPTAYSLSPNEQICDKVTGEEGEVISIKILKWLDEDRVRVQWSWTRAPNVGEGHEIFLKLQEGDWVFDGEDESSYWAE